MLYYDAFESMLQLWCEMSRQSAGMLLQQECSPCIQMTLNNSWMVWSKRWQFDGSEVLLPGRVESEFSMCSSPVYSQIHLLIAVCSSHGCWMYWIINPIKCHLCFILTSMHRDHLCRYQIKLYVISVIILKLVCGYFKKGDKYYACKNNASLFFHLNTFKDRVKSLHFYFLIYCAGFESERIYFHGFVNSQLSFVLYIVIS